MMYGNALSCMEAAGTAHLQLNERPQGQQVILTQVAVALGHTLASALCRQHERRW